MRALAAQIEAAASPTPSREPQLPSPAASATPRLKPADSLRAHPLLASIMLDDAAPEMASTQLTSYWLAPLREDGDEEEEAGVEKAESVDQSAAPEKSTEPVLAAVEEEEPRAKEVANAAATEQKGSSTEAAATQTDHQAQSMLTAVDVATSCEVPSAVDAACNTEEEERTAEAGAAVERPLGVSVGVSADLMPPEAAAGKTQAGDEQVGRIAVHEPTS